VRFFIKIVGLGLVAVAAASCSTPHLPSNQSAAEQFARLGTGEKRVASTFYDLGTVDTIKRLYWAQRRAQETGGTADAPASASLQRRYVNVPIPAHTDPDGTEIEASTRAVEIVQLWSVVPSHGRWLFKCN
jgi:hypothetical protein